MKKKLIAGAICLAFVGACSQQDGDNKSNSKIEKKEAQTTEMAVAKSGIEIENMDSKTRPQDDFYRFVNGAWLDKTEIPADKSTYGSFTALSDKSRRDVKAIIEETSKLENVEKGSDAQKVGDLYRSYMNTDKLNELGASPLLPEIEKIDAMENHDDVSVYFAETQLIGTDAPFGFWVNNDSKNPTEYITFFSQSGLGLPDKDYYFKQDEKSEKLRNDYVEHVGKMFALTGIKDAESNAKKVMALETAIADIHWTRVERRDRDKTYRELCTITK